MGTCHSLYAATTDPAVIGRWFEGHPFWNVGLAPGAASGLVALDVDVDHGGLDSFVELLHQGLDITGAAMQLSGSGRSFHVIYSTSSSSARSTAATAPHRPGRFSCCPGP